MYRTIYKNVSLSIADGMLFLPPPPGHLCRPHRSPHVYRPRSPEGFLLLYSAASPPDSSLPIISTSTYRNEMSGRRCVRFVVSFPCFHPNHFAPPRFASRNRTFFFTIDQLPSAAFPYQVSSEYSYNSPTGSYFSMLSGRCWRGRVKVL